MKEFFVGFLFILIISVPYLLSFVFDFIINIFLLIGFIGLCIGVGNALLH